MLFVVYLVIVNNQERHFVIGTSPQYTVGELFKQYNSFSLLVSANTVSIGSTEGCGAPGLEKAPIDGGISQGALCLWSLAQSALF